MATVQELETQLAALRKARYSGVRSLTHNGTTTEYKSDQEMAAAERALLAELGDLNGTRSNGVSVASFSADG